MRLLSKGVIGIIPDDFQLPKDSYEDLGKLKLKKEKEDQLATSWATVDDLYARYGDEFMDKLGTRRVWDADLETYVADESDSSRRAVIQLALDDAQAFLLYKIACKFSGVEVLSTELFNIVRSWHAKLTIETLKIGGDCTNCTECNTAFDSFLECGKICNSDGTNCLASNKTFISATEYKSDCECMGSCGCCQTLISHILSRYSFGYGKIHL